MLAGTQGVAGYAESSAIGAPSLFNTPGWIALDNATSTLYVADQLNHRIRTVYQNGTTEILVGSGSPGYANGVGTSAQFFFPWSLSLFQANFTLYVASAASRVVQTVQVAGRAVELLAGAPAGGYADGTGSAVLFTLPQSVTSDSAGNAYVCDTTGYRVRMVFPNGTTWTMAGTGVSGNVDGPGSSAQFSNLRCISSANGTLFVADQQNNKVRLVTRQPGGGVVVSTFAGTGAAGFLDGPRATALFRGPFWHGN